MNDIALKILIKSNDVTINGHTLLGTLISQLGWCSKQAKKDGFISQECLGRILTINTILIEYYGMSWEETQELFLEFGLETNKIKKEF